MKQMRRRGRVVSHIASASRILNSMPREAARKGAPMAVVTVRWLGSNGELVTGAEGDLESAAKSGATWLWVDVSEPDGAALEPICPLFKLHPLAVEDAEHDQYRAKLDQYPSGLFLAWLTPEHPRGDGITTSELDVFIGKDHLVTLHKKPLAVLDQVARDAPLSMQAGPAWTLHKIVDLLVDGTLPLIDRVGEQLSAIEDKMLSNPRQDDLRSLHRVRRQLVRLHRIVAPERDLLRGLVREGDIIDEDAYRYFQDVGDHLARALDEIETFQDVGASVMDVYLSAQSNRMNEIMKQLTVVATIFMPLTLITGIYGMNLTAGMWPPPGDTHVWAFWAVMASMVALSVVMAVYFRKKNWW
jgi:magnesium transporter